MVRAGIIGCGKIALTRHIPEYASNPLARPAGFFDINEGRAKALAEQYQGHFYRNYQEMLADPEIDAVSILTPNVTHSEIAVAAMRAGKDVLCEKPMAVTAEQCRQMVKVMKETGRKLMVAQNQRLAPAHIQAKKLIGQGKLGKVISFETVFAHCGADHWSIDGRNSWFMDKNSSCFGAMADLGIHKTDLMIYLLGQRVSHVSAVLCTLDKKTDQGIPISVDDNAFCTYVMENGAVGTMRASWTNYGQEINSTSIYGTEGALHIYRNPAHTLVLEKKDGTEEFWDTAAMQTNGNQTSTGIIDAFVDSIESGRPPEISAEDVMPAMEAIFACVKSSEEGGRLVEV